MELKIWLEKRKHGENAAQDTANSNQNQKSISVED